MDKDLISREALKEKAETVTLWNGEVRRFVSYETIDNAQTVEPQKIVTIPHELIEKLVLCVVDTVENIDWDKAIEAYKERPQGEWVESHICSCEKILRMGMDVIEHKCKNCGRWSIKWARTIPDSFCSNCGAKIKKGGAE